MERKAEMLHTLPHVKLVIGNGFDLYCGLKTTYRDFFLSRKQELKKLEEWIDLAAKTIFQQLKSTDRTKRISLFTPTEIKLYNCWDAFFVLRSGEEDRLWCEVEKEMLESLKRRDKDVEDDYSPHWEDVWQYINTKSDDGVKPGTIILGRFIVWKKGCVLETREAFYGFLLEQLREFELSFAKFIISQHFRTNTFQYSRNTAYIENARSLINELVDLDSLISIDCFNYGFTPESEFFQKCKFVNGDVCNPIFGVDSVFEPADPRYIFTKTNRRIEWDMNNTQIYINDAFENVVVFGHSLSSHDYNYFFPILDQLEMTNFQSKKKIVIAYSIYDQARKEAIKKSVRSAIYSLFVAYARYCGREDNGARLLDSLTAQGRVLTYETRLSKGKNNGLIGFTDDIWQVGQIEKGIAERWQEYIETGKDLLE